MPSRAPRACWCGTVDCTVHRRKPWQHTQPSRRARGYGRLAAAVRCERGQAPHQTWDSLRACILERDRRRCRYCPAEASTADHVLAKANGGTNDEANLVAACWACHKAKSAREGAAARRRTA